MSTTYELVTIKDIFDHIPAHKIEQCMDEMKAGMLQAKAASMAMKGIAHEVTGDANNSKSIWPDSCVWVDDGKGEVTTEVSINGEAAFTIQG
jgi:hypothetical protein